MKNNLILTAVAAVLVGFVVGNITALGSDDTKNETTSEHMDVELNSDGDTHSDGDETMHGGMFMVSVDEAPTVSVSVTEDTKSGWNVRIETTDFQFTPENINQTNVAGEGHAHLYVDGEKIGRLYGPDYHYAENFEDAKTFRVTLNANDHSEYAVDGIVIDEATEVVHESHSE